MEQLLSQVNGRTEIRFLIRFGETRTLLREKGPGRRAVPVAVTVTGRSKPLPTTIEEGEGYRGDEAKERVEGLDVMREEAPESKLKEHLGP